jgi:hypothetical protein
MGQRDSEQRSLAPQHQAQQRSQAPQHQAQQRSQAPQHQAQQVPSESPLQTDKHVKDLLRKIAVSKYLIMCDTAMQCSLLIHLRATNLHIYPRYHI